jgi:hypothetical protein
VCSLSIYIYWYIYIYKYIQPFVHAFHCGARELVFFLHWSRTYIRHIYTTYIYTYMHSLTLTLYLYMQPFVRALSSGTRKKTLHLYIFTFKLYSSTKHKHIYVCMYVNIFTNPPSICTYSLSSVPSLAAQGKGYFLYW